MRTIFLYKFANNKDVNPNFYGLSYIELKIIQNFYYIKKKDNNIISKGIQIDPYNHHLDDTDTGATSSLLSPYQDRPLEIPTQDDCSTNYSEPLRRSTKIR